MPVDERGHRTNAPIYRDSVAVSATAPSDSGRFGARCESGNAAVSKLLPAFWDFNETRLDGTLESLTRGKAQSRHTWNHEWVLLQGFGSVRAMYQQYQPHHHKEQWEESGRDKAQQTRRDSDLEEETLRDGCFGLICSPQFADCLNPGQNAGVDEQSGENGYKRQHLTGAPHC